MDYFTTIWDRIAALAGSELTQKTGRLFTYTVTGNAVVRSTTNRRLARTRFQRDRGRRRRREPARPGPRSVGRPKQPTVNTAWRLQYRVPDAVRTARDSLEG